MPAWTNATDRTATVAGVLRPGELARHVALHPLADLAVAHGWYDQAHVTRESIELVGVTPGAYRARR